MRLESQRLEKRISQLKEQIATFPKGKLICSQVREGYYKWYCRDNHHSVYIPKKQRNHAEQLAMKKYLLLQVEDLEHEKKAIDFYLRHHVPSKAEEMLNEISAYQELLSPFFKPQSQRLYDWMKAPYNCNVHHSENKIHKTCSGNMVRSKSEALIDMVLSVNKIPFRYECELRLNDAIVYPDFTILHPRTEEIFYWEHFGKMDDPRYAKRTGEKLQMYIANGIIPTKNLITTYEMMLKPLDMESLDKIVKDYFR